MPGRILNALKTVGVKNPVILLDEVDKMVSYLNYILYFELLLFLRLIKDSIITTSQFSFHRERVFMEIHQLLCWKSWTLSRTGHL